MIITYFLALLAGLTSLIDKNWLIKMDWQKYGFAYFEIVLY